MSLFGKSREKREQENREKSRLLAEMIRDLGFEIEGLRVDYYDTTVTVHGVTQSEEDKKRIVLSLKSAQDVDRVNDLLRVAPPKPESAPVHPEMPAAGDAAEQKAPSENAKTPETEVDGPTPVSYTVKPGDTLSKIAKAHYGDASKYPVIFEANRPMLTHPDKIYPGQLLRIPPLV